MAAPPTLRSLLEPWCCLRERGAREGPEMSAGAGLALLEQKEVEALTLSHPHSWGCQPPLLPGDRHCA